MSRRTLAAIAFLALSLLTMCGGAQPEEAGEEQIEEMAANATEDLQTEKNVSFMFVQNAQSGTLMPVEGEENLYTLTLMGVAPQTIAFSDRPERIVVQAPMQKFLDGLCFSPENPPNAAIEILDADEDMDVAVVELFDPVYDNASQTLQYNISILEEPDHSYAVFNERADQALPETFGPVTLFIDDCADSSIGCQKGPYTWSERCGEFHTGCCWSWSDFTCEACHSYNSYVDQCVKTYGSSCSDIVDYCGEM